MAPPSIHTPSSWVPQSGASQATSAAPAAKGPIRMGAWPIDMLQTEPLLAQEPWPDSPGTAPFQMLPSMVSMEVGARPGVQAHYPIPQHFFSAPAGPQLMPQYRPVRQVVVPNAKELQSSQLLFDRARELESRLKDALDRAKESAESQVMASESSFRSSTDASSQESGSTSQSAVVAGALDSTDNLDAALAGSSGLGKPGDVLTVLNDLGLAVVISSPTATASTGSQDNGNGKASVFQAEASYTLQPGDQSGLRLNASASLSVKRAFDGALMATAKLLGGKDVIKVSDLVLMTEKNQRAKELRRQLRELEEQRMSLANELHVEVQASPLADVDAPEAGRSLSQQGSQTSPPASAATPSFLKTTSMSAEHSPVTFGRRQSSASQPASPWTSWSAQGSPQVRKIVVQSPSTRAGFAVSKSPTDQAAASSLAALASSSRSSPMQISSPSTGNNLGSDWPSKATSSSPAAGSATSPLMGPSAAASSTSAAVAFGASSTPAAAASSPAGFAAWPSAASPKPWPSAASSPSPQQQPQQVRVVTSRFQMPPVSSGSSGGGTTNHAAPSSSSNGKSPPWNSPGASSAWPSWSASASASASASGAASGTAWPSQAPETSWSPAGFASFPSTFPITEGHDEGGSPQAAPATAPAGAGVTSQSDSPGSSLAAADGPDASVSTAETSTTGVNSTPPHGRSPEHSATAALVDRAPSESRDAPQQESLQAGSPSGPPQQSIESAGPQSPATSPQQSITSNSPSVAPPAPVEVDVPPGPSIPESALASAPSPTEPSPSSSESPPELPYNGDLAAAMRAQDRPAIRMIMERRDSSAQGHTQSPSPAPSPSPSPSPSPTPVEESSVDVHLGEGGSRSAQGPGTPEAESDSSPPSETAQQPLQLPSIVCTPPPPDAATTLSTSPVTPADLTDDQKNMSVQMLVDVGVDEETARAALVRSHWYMEAAMRYLTAQSSPPSLPAVSPPAGAQELETPILTMSGMPGGSVAPPPGPTTGSSGGSRLQPPNPRMPARAGAAGAGGRRRNRAGNAGRSRASSAASSASSGSAMSRSASRGSASAGDRSGRSGGRNRGRSSGAVAPRPMTEAQREQAVQLVMGMGFEQDAAMAALLTTDWNVEQAVQMLCT